MELYDDHRDTSNQLYRKFNYIQAERERNPTGNYMKNNKCIGRISDTFSWF